MSWICKLTGILFTAVGAAGIGISEAIRYKERLHLLEDLRKMVSLLKGEILYANAPLEEAFIHVGERCSSPAGKVFLNMAEEMGKKRGDSFYEMWKAEVDSLGKEIPLSKEDKRQLKGFGENLGYLDRAMQERTMALYLEQLSGEITYLKEHLQEKNRLYTSLGIAAGVFLIIIMC
ncbi:stage III sporulation protein AB [Lachnospiraceae bacterium 62-35]